MVNWFRAGRCLFQLDEALVALPATIHSRTVRMGLPFGRPRACLASFSLLRCAAGTDRRVLQVRSLRLFVDARKTSQTKIKGKIESKIQATQPITNQRIARYMSRLPVGTDSNAHASELGSARRDTVHFDCAFLRTGRGKRLRGPLFPLRSLLRRRERERIPRFRCSPFPSTILRLLFSANSLLVSTRCDSLRDQKPDSLF